MGLVGYFRRCDDDDTTGEGITSNFMFRNCVFRVRSEEMRVLPTVHYIGAFIVVLPVKFIVVSSVFISH